MRISYLQPQMVVRVALGEAKCCPAAGQHRQPDFAAPRGQGRGLETARGPGAAIGDTGADTYILCMSSRQYIL